MSLAGGWQAFEESTPAMERGAQGFELVHEFLEAVLRDFRRLSPGSGSAVRPPRRSNAGRAGRWRRLRRWASSAARSRRWHSCNWASSKRENTW